MRQLKSYWPPLVLWIVGLALVVWFIASSETFQNCVEAAKNQTSDQSAKNSVSYVLISRCTGDFVTVHHDAITALSTLFIALFTLTLWFATWRLWRSSERHAERELRAYITVVPTGLFNIDPNLRLVSTITIINGGRTPAHRVEQAAIIRMEQHPLAPSFPFPNLAGIARNSRMVVAPQIPHGGQAIADQDFTQNQIVEILQAPTQGGRRLYLFGQIDYLDAFDVPRWTRYCFSFQGRHDLIPLAQQGNWVGIAQIISQPGFNFSFEATNQHNESE